MIQKVINRLLQRRHFWRTVGFDELSEIYASQFLRSLATSLIGIFVPIFLYKSGFSIPEICLMFIGWFISRFLWAYVSAKIVANLGPKHGIAISIILQIIYLSLVLSVNNFHWPLMLIGIVGSFAYGLFMMSFDVDFSKIKHSEHGGKEIAFVHIFESIGAIAGPLIGGLIAGFYDPRYTMFIAIIILFLSLIPIFMSPEPTRTKQEIVLKGFPMRRHKRDFLVGAVFTLENVISLNIWPLFLGVFILLTNTYISIGILASVSTAVAISTIYIIGKLIDKSQGRKLLNIGAIGNAILHTLRPFVTTFTQAFGINLLNVPLTSMYRMPFMKGLYDASDSVPGYRIVYFLYYEWYTAIANIIFWSYLFLISYYFGDFRALQSAFIVGAVLSLLITKQKFAALK
jgi:MFS family permease